MDYKDILIDSLGSGTAAFLKFELSSYKYDDVIATFVEGQDYSYYRSRIEKTSKYPSEKIICFPCNGRLEVEKAYKLVNDSCIRKNPKVKLLFFADRDYDVLPQYKDIYYTDLYSIENFYCSEIVLKKILNEIFCMNKYVHDFEICLDLYRKKFKEYRNEMTKVNAYCYCLRKKEIVLHLDRTNFDEIKFTKFVEHSGFDNFKMKNLKFTEIKKTFSSKTKINYSEYKMTFSEISESKYRGKWELQFFCWFLNELKIAIKNGSYGLEKNSRIKLDFQSQPLICLSAYAEDSSQLDEYVLSRIK